MKFFYPSTISTNLLASSEENWISLRTPTYKHNLSAHSINTGKKMW